MGSAARVLSTLEAEVGGVPAWLRVHEHATADAEPWTLAGEAPLWDELGSAFESSLASATRRRRGAHFTPRWLADGLTELTIERPVQRVLDPACGAGAFLLAALDRLVALGTEPADALTSIAGIDVDSTSLAVTEACLWAWAIGHGVRPSRPAQLGCLRVGDALLTPPGESVARADVVFGNPPFLGQLARDTVRPRARSQRLRHRFGDAVAAYTDESALFLLDGLERVRAGGVVGLLQPRSVLASRDARGVRSRVGAVGAVAALWLDDGPAFGAEVRVCAPVVRRCPVDEVEPTVAIHRGIDFRLVARPRRIGGDTWAPLAEAGGDGAPEVTLTGRRTLGDVATVTAGFRDEYYGLVGAVVESEGCRDRRPRLVTSGAIDPAHLRWGRHPTRFAKARWIAPVVALDSIEDDRVAAWVRGRLVPKILVASQTSVVECVVDEGGLLVPSVPVVSVEPRDPADLWTLATALSAPATTAWLRWRSAGTARSVDAIKVSAADLRALPVPDSVPERAVDGLRRAHHADDVEERRVELLGFGDAMEDARDGGDDVRSWWARRLRVR